MFGGLVIECDDDVGCGQGVFAAGRKGATGGPLMKAWLERSRDEPWRPVLMLGINTCKLERNNDVYRSASIADQIGVLNT
jgi:hypothetical protein